MSEVNAVSSMQEYIPVGRINAAFGVRGWVKVFSHTEPRDNILGYSPWYLKSRDGWRAYRVVEGQVHGKGIIARLEGIDDRNQAELLLGSDVGILPGQRPELGQGEYYWSDLVGLRVVTLEGVDLGKVDYLFETGANDVLVIQGDRERLLPFVEPQVVKRVALDEALIEVDWDPEF